MSNLITRQGNSRLSSVTKSFFAVNENELTIDEGDIVTVINSKREDVWFVEKKEGQKGYVPAANLKPFSGSKKAPGKPKPKLKPKPNLKPKPDPKTIKKPEVESVANSSVKNQREFESDNEFEEIEIAETYSDEDSESSDEQTSLALALSLQQVLIKDPSKSIRSSNMGNFF